MKRFYVWYDMSEDSDYKVGGLSPMFWNILNNHYLNHKQRVRCQRILRKLISAYGNPWEFPFGGVIFYGLLVPNARVGGGSDIPTKEDTLRAYEELVKVDTKILYGGTK